MSYDLIRRQDAIDAVGSMFRRKFGIGGDLAEITLAGLPSAQPERKKGKWIRNKIKDLVGFNTSCYKCSECNAVEAVYSAYCPNCGADMRGEPDEVN